MERVVIRCRVSEPVANDGATKAVMPGSLPAAAAGAIGMKLDESHLQAS
jgi:hypothetical protein